MPYHNKTSHHTDKGKINIKPSMSSGYKVAGLGVKGSDMPGQMLGKANKKIVNKRPGRQGLGMFGDMKYRGEMEIKVPGNPHY